VIQTSEEKAGLNVSEKERRKRDQGRQRVKVLNSKHTNYSVEPQGLKTAQVPVFEERKLQPRKRSRTLSYLPGLHKAGVDLIKFQPRGSYDLKRREGRVRKDGNS